MTDAQIKEHLIWCETHFPGSCALLARGAMPKDYAGKDLWARSEFERAVAAAKKQCPDRSSK